MNKTVKAVEQYIDENEEAQEIWSDNTKDLINCGVNPSVAKDAVYAVLFSKLLNKLSKRMLEESVSRNSCRCRFRK